MRRTLDEAFEARAQEQGRPTGAHLGLSAIEIHTIARNWIGRGLPFVQACEGAITEALERQQPAPEPPVVDPAGERSPLIWEQLFRLWIDTTRASIETMQGKR